MDFYEDRCRRSAGAELGRKILSEACGIVKFRTAGLGDWNFQAKPFSILTGGPGCGKTTTTNILVKLLQAMNKNVLLAAPTGRAAQRMSDVIGVEAKTIHRLLEWAPDKGGFKRSRRRSFKTGFFSRR